MTIERWKKNDEENCFIQKLRCVKKNPTRPAEVYISYYEQAMIHQLEEPQNQRLLEYDLRKLSSVSISDREGNVHLLRFDPQLENEFLNVSHLFIDGTFQTTLRVRGVCQLIAVLGVKYDHAIPIAHILMSR